MPPGPPMGSVEIAVLEQWIAAGAVWPKSFAPLATPFQTWWSFKKPVRPAVPAMKDAWAKTPVDAFVLQSRRFLQYDPARGYDLAEVGRQARLYEISDQRTALLWPGGPRRPGTTAPAKSKTARQLSGGGGS